MKIPAGALIAFVLLFFGCKQSPGGDSENATNKDTVRFFQVRQYVQSQINEVNATPYFIYQLDITNNHKDSIPINTAIFNRLAKNFLEPDINNTDIKKYYTENIFEDQTTKSFTISYSTTNKLLTLQNVEILLKEDGQTVKRLFLRKFYNHPDSSVIEQLSWKPGESFQLNRSVQKAGDQEQFKQTVVVWNKNT